MKCLINFCFNLQSTEVWSLAKYSVAIMKGFVTRTSWNKYRLIQKKYQFVRSISFDSYTLILLRFNNSVLAWQMDAGFANAIFEHKHVWHTTGAKTTHFFSSSTVAKLKQVHSQKNSNEIIESIGCFWKMHRTWSKVAFWLIY